MSPKCSILQTVSAVIRPSKKCLECLESAAIMMLSGVINVKMVVPPPVEIPLNCVFASKKMRTKAASTKLFFIPEFNHISTGTTKHLYGRSVKYVCVSKLFFFAQPVVYQQTFVKWNMFIILVNRVRKKIRESGIRIIL